MLLPFRLAPLVVHFFQWCLQEILSIAWDRHFWAFPFSFQFLFCNAGSKGCHTLPSFVALSPACIQYLVLHLQILECLFRVCIIDFLSSRIFHYQKFIPNKHLHQKIIRNPYPSKTHSQARVVDLSLNQAAKPWFHQYLDLALGAICGG